MAKDTPITETITMAEFQQLCVETKMSLWIKTRLDFPFDNKLIEWLPVNTFLFKGNARLKDARQVVIQRYEGENCIFIEQFIK